MGVSGNDTSLLRLLWNDPEITKPMEEAQKSYDEKHSDRTQ